MTDQSLANHVTAILQCLSDKLQVGKQLYLALDNSHRVLSDDELLLDEAAKLKGFVVPLKYRSLNPVMRPHWLPLTGENSEYLLPSIEQALQEASPDLIAEGCGRRVAGWLEISGDAKQAALHISGQMIRSSPLGGKHLLRLHDPAVLWALWPLLNHEQQKYLLGPVASWSLIAPNGQLMALQIKPDTGNNKGTPEIWGRLLWQDIALIAPFNQALLAYLAQNADLQIAQLDHLHELGFAAIKRARLLGFSDDADLALFAQHAFTIHPFFDRHSLLQKCLAARQADSYYGGLVADLSDSDWQNIAASTV
ncbi:DUF4123 domain-containing protein [Iodobacter ciconiae]|uniref:Uncharacterized protein n=1 Tax=Iodobacter ciconiae TaxID=2496266 RepID=A0A3S8ZRI2_9NEIS|nr:DUF4123 domain-containing protein [Iodobacter ciconiae]AZN36103.1 hypothetical protein EJO50_06190 [Iodobacter ciconiae]